MYKYPSHMKEQTSLGLHTETLGEQVTHKNFLFTHYILFSLPFIILLSTFTNLSMSMYPIPTRNLFFRNNPG